MRGLGLVAVLLVGCSSDPEPMDHVIELVDWNECLSSSCEIGASASCTLDASTFPITSFATWTDIRERQQTCTADCGLLEAVCKASLTIPSEMYGPSCL